MRFPSKATPFTLGASRAMSKLVFALLVCVSESLAQGWEHVGPDSSGWQSVREINVRRFGADSLYLAACTDAGIAVKLTGRAWDYSLRNSGDGTFFPYLFYRTLQFSPWEADSAFLGIEVVHTDPVPGILKIPIPSQYPPMWLTDLTGWCFTLPSEVFFPVEADSLVYSLMCGVYSSSKPWRNWIPIVDSVYNVAEFLAIDRTNPAILWSHQSRGPGQIVIHTVNHGATWDTLTSFPFIPESKTILAMGDTILLAKWVPWDSTAVKGIMRSTDGGRTWHPRYTESGVSVLRWGRGNTVFAGGPDGILVSEDAGWSWRTFNNGLPGTFVTDIAVNPGSDTLLVSVLNHGVLKVWSFLVSVGSGTPCPERFMLQQNYPNPFNPSTTIRYGLPGRSNVVLTVYNTLGQQVATLVQGEQEAGFHEVQFDASGLSSGVYLYRLQAGDFISTKRMLILK